MDLYFATSNRYKFQEAAEIFEKRGMKLLWHKFSHTEIRSEDLKEIADEAVMAAHKEIKKPVFVEDSGLFIDTLNGFPGAYTAYVHSKIGLEGILKLMGGMANRAVSYRACVSFYDGKAIRSFMGVCEGTLAEGIRGDDGFGHDPIFIPKGHRKTFAESIGLKNKLSHRYISLSKLLEHLDETGFDCQMPQV